MTTDLWILLSFTSFCLMMVVFVRPRLSRMIHAQRSHIVQQISDLHKQKTQAQAAHQAAEEALKTAQQKADSVSVKTQQLIHIMQEDHTHKREAWAQSTTAATQNLIRYMSDNHEKALRKTVLQASLQEVREAFIKDAQSQQDFLNGLLHTLENENLSQKH